MEEIIFGIRKGKISWVLRIVWLVVIMDMVIIMVNESAQMNFLVNSELAAKLYANYKPIPFLQVKAKILTIYKLELHEVNTIIEFALEIVTRDGIREDIRKSLV